MIPAKGVVIGYKKVMLQSGIIVKTDKDFSIGANVHVCFDEHRRITNILDAKEVISAIEEPYCEEGARGETYNE